MKKLFYYSILIVFISTSVFPAIAKGQTGEWKVWVKASPCSGRFDWITVAKENPTGGGGSNFYYLANSIFPGTMCTNFGCTFAEATAIANTLRPSTEFFKYCCRDYSVWEHNQTRARTVVLGKFGTAGNNWVQIKSDLCCEEAEALAGVPGACSSAANQQAIVNNTKCWPGSHPVWNKETRKVECYCNTGLVWNSTKTACVDPKTLVQEANCSGYPGTMAVWSEQNQRVECHCKPGLVWNKTNTACVEPKKLVEETDCSGYPGSYAAWNEQAQRLECYCPTGKVWNSARTACIDDPAQVKCWPGSYAKLNTQTGKTECFCNPGLVWNSTKTACIEKKKLVEETDCSGYPGSYAAWNEQAQRVECYCPTGKVWNSARTACIDEVTQVKCWPGSYAAVNPQTGKTECYCNPGLVWNSTKTACVDPQELVRAADCSGYPGSYAAWNAQAQRVECYCPTGKIWNSARTACVDATGAIGGTGNWTLVSTTTFPEKQGGGWTFNTGGTAHFDIYNGDKADFQWTPPPQQFSSNGFTISLNVQSKPQANSRLAALMGVTATGTTSNNPNKQGAYANAPAEKSSDQTQVTFTPNSSEVKVTIDLMWGGVRIVYLYKKM